jgi:FixJ family two-component response regulator
MNSLVAVVDDEPSVLRALRRLLEAADFDIVIFGSAEELLASDCLARIGCLVLDIYLGGVSGFDVHEQLAAKGHPIPTIFITGGDDATTRERALTAGGVEYLVKPFNDTALITAVQKLSAPGTCAKRGRHEG